MPTNLVVSGGPLHDFDASSAAVIAVLEREGISSTLPTGPGHALALLDGDQRWDMVTVNALLWPMDGERHAHLRDDWSFRATDTQVRALEGHVLRGGGLLALHGAVISFPHPRWTSTLGAAWNWERSSHPPADRASVSVTGAGRDHPVTGAVDDFSLDDEVYGFLDLAPDLVPLLTSRHGGVDHPLLWTRSIGAGRVVVDLLGHDRSSIEQADHAAVIGGAARWLVGARPAGGPR